jgi:hypothetical protein
METATGTGSTLTFLPGPSPVRIGLAQLADECAALTRELHRDLEPLHRLGDDLLARLGSSPGGSAHSR